MSISKFIVNAHLPTAMKDPVDNSNKNKPKNPNNTNNPYSDFELLEYTFDGLTKTVFKKGAGPAVIVMHEVPGLYPEIVEFGRKVIDQGFTVYLPSVLGVPGKGLGVGYSIASMCHACVSKEFTVWATGKNSPVTKWLHKLAAQANQECDNKGVGAVGMCLTGGFALAMMVDDFIKAPVLSQPSLPFAITQSQKKDLGIDPETIRCVKDRATKGQEVMGLRFTNDFMVPAERFHALQDLLGERFISVEIDSSFGNPHGITPVAHSVLVHHNEDKLGHPTKDALDKVLSFLKEKLL